MVTARREPGGRGLAWPCSRPSPVGFLAVTGTRG